MTPHTIHLSNGTSFTGRLEIWDDWSVERSGYVRAYWANPETNSGVPVLGLTDPRGTHRYIRQALAQCRRMFPGEPVYRNGRKLVQKENNQ
jgi:hypothetical protein